MEDVMTYLKHASNGKGNGRRAAKSAKKPEEPTRVVVTGPDEAATTPTPPLQHEINYVAGMDGVEQSLDWIAKGLSRLTSDDHVVGLSVGQGQNISPIKLTFAENDYDDTMDRFVSAVERIADSLARLAGLSRPRLERWYEPDEYKPRFRDSACDGGAPGVAIDSRQGEGRVKS
jgi:hypothetical protein